MFDLLATTRRHPQLRVVVCDDLLHEFFGHQFLGLLELLTGFLDVFLWYFWALDHLQKHCLDLIAILLFRVNYYFIKYIFLYVT